MLRKMPSSFFFLLFPFCRSLLSVQYKMPSPFRVVIRLMVKPLSEKHLVPGVLFTLSRSKLCDHVFPAAPEPIRFESQFQEWKGCVTHVSLLPSTSKTHPYALVTCCSVMPRSLSGFTRGKGERRAMDCQWGYHGNGQENSLWTTLWWISRPFTSRSSGDALPRKWNKGNSKPKISTGVVFKQKHAA